MTTSDQDLDASFRELNLLRMAEISRDVLRRCQDGKWSYKRLLAELIAEEKSYRKERILKTRIEKATLPEKWTLETYPFHLQPGVDRTQFQQLAELDFIKQGMNLVLIGTTGVGKTGLATSLLMKALLNGHTGAMQKAQDLLDDLHRSIADRKTRYLLNRYSKFDLLAIDELGYLCLNADQANLFFKLMDNRYSTKKSTIITTNLGYDAWGQHLGNPAMVEALLSRLKQRCVTILINGTDLRTAPQQ